MVLTLKIDRKERSKSLVRKEKKTKKREITRLCENKLG